MMNTDLAHEPLMNPDVFKLASQLYVRLRRSGRVVDAVYMSQNTAYAREVARLAARETDIETLSLVTRLEAVLDTLEADTASLAKATAPVKPAITDLPAESNDFFFATLRPKRMAAALKEGTLPVMPAVAVQTPVAEAVEEEVAQHYIGALR